MGLSGLQECGPITEKVMVMTLLDRALDVVCIRLGYKKRVYTDVCIYMSIYVTNGLRVNELLFSNS